ncbi:MAG: hypothetical protein ACREJB_02985, partial [Planctomycetaceae bacterium]
MWFPSPRRRALLSAAIVAILLIPATARATDEADSTVAVPVAQRDALVYHVRSTVEITSRRYLIADEHTPWQILHGILSLRYDFRIKEDGKKINAVRWMSEGVTHRGEPWFEKTRFGGRAHPYTKAMEFEGHPNQTLAILAMAGLPPEHELQVEGGTITIADIVRNSQQEVQRNEEPTWTLWALSRYLEPDAEWINRHNEPWSIERLVQWQTEEAVNNQAACGGTHGLFALAFALDQYRKKTGNEPRGVWLEADQKLQRYIAEARALQNRDGSFSALYFAGPRHTDDVNDRVATTGHV